MTWRRHHGPNLLGRAGLWPSAGSGTARWQALEIHPPQRSGGLCQSRGLGEAEKGKALLLTQ